MHHHSVDLIQWHSLTLLVARAPTIFTLPVPVIAMGAEPDAALYKDEEYADDDFEEQDGALSGTKLSILAVAGQVHPLDPVSENAATPTLVKTTAAVDDEEEGYEDDGSTYSDDDFEADKIARSISALTVQDESRDFPTSARSNNVGHDSAHDGVDDVESAEDTDCPSKTYHSVTSNAQSEVDLVSIHAHREPELLLPPPAPADQVSLLSDAALERNLHLLRLSEKRATVAAKRILEYRETQAHREAQLAAETAAAKKRREQFRASNRKIYEQMGVSKLTGEQRYQLLVEERKLLKQHRDASAKLEKQQRWYNAKPAAECSRKHLAPGHVIELQVRHGDVCKQRQRDTVQHSQIIMANQAELHLQAQAIVAKCTQKQYVRGSYLQKKVKPTHTSQSQKKTHAVGELLAHDNNMCSPPVIQHSDAPAVHEII